MCRGFFILCSVLYEISVDMKILPDHFNHIISLRIKLNNF